MKVVIFDVDGVFTDGKFIYSEAGKVFKSFGADDNDAISLLAEYVEVRCVTGDRKGFAISKARIVSDMGLPLDLVSTTKRLEWISKIYDLGDVIYMGDGIFDHFVMENVGYAIAPANADVNAKRAANYVTERSGGDRAVAEACIHIMSKFFIPYDGSRPLNSKVKFSGEWTA